MLLLEDKCIIITGALTGIGRETVKMATEYGAKVVSTSRRGPEDPSAIKLIEECKDNPGSVVHMKCDVTNKEEVNRVFAEAVKIMGKLDCLLNCAGTAQQPGPVEEYPEEAFREQFEVHVMGTLFTNQAAFPYMKENGGGSIVDFGSWAGTQGLAGDFAYGTMKGAVAAFVRNVALEWGKYNIRVNNACPSAWTEIADAAFAHYTEEQLAEVKAWLRSISPLNGRMPTAREASGMNIFLASDLSCAVTGQIMAADNGQVFVR